MAERIPKIVTLGPVYVDVAIKCEHFPRPGQTVDGWGVSSVPTGAGATAAVSAALCGCESYLIGKVGDDAYGRFAVDFLQDHEVHTEFVFKAPAMSTGTVLTMVDSQGENCSCLAPGANRALSQEEVTCALVEQLISTVNACLITGSLPQEIVVSMIRMAELHRTRRILVVDLPLAEQGKIDHLNWPIEYFNANILVPRILSSSVNPESSAGALSEIKFIGTELVAKGLECAVIPMGTRGVLVVDRDGPHHLEGFEYERVENSVCDDAFAAALSACCGCGDDPITAAKFAYAAQVLACSRFGGLDALPTRREIIELLQNRFD